MGVSFESVMQVATALSSLYMCASPSVGVYHIHRARDVGQASIIPFVTLWTCNHIWTLYGYVTNNVFPVLITYAVGDVLSIVFIAVYARWAVQRAYVVRVCLLALAINLLATLYVVLSESGAIGSSGEATTVTSILAIGSSLALYASPLAAIKTVVQTKSSASLPVAMVLAGVVNNALWVIYGSLVQDLVLVIPTAINVTLGVVQVVLYVVYHPSRTATAETEPEDAASWFVLTPTASSPKSDPAFDFSAMKGDSSFADPAKERGSYVITVEAIAIEGLQRTEKELEPANDPQ